MTHSAENLVSHGLTEGHKFDDVDRPRGISRLCDDDVHVPDGRCILRCERNWHGIVGVPLHQVGKHTEIREVTGPSLMMSKVFQTRCTYFVGRAFTQLVPSPISMGWISSTWTKDILALVAMSASMLDECGSLQREGEREDAESKGSFGI